jgi:hypothetical protein
MITDLYTIFITQSKPKVKYAEAKKPKNLVTHIAVYIESALVIRTKKKKKKKKTGFGPITLIFHTSIQ